MPGQRSKLRWVIWALAALFYFYEYLLRVSVSVMVPELMQDFHIDAAEVGSLSAYYFWAYAPMQLPAGMLMDRFGARRLLTLATIVCGVGSILVGISPYLWVAQLGRLFTGLGSAFAFVGLLYVCSHWFHVGKLALLVGLGNSLGMLGGVFGEGPLGISVDAFGWRATSAGLGIAGLILAAILYFVIKGAPMACKTKHNLEKLWENLRTVAKNPQTWINAIIALLFLATTTTFAGLWAVDFLTTSYGMTKVVAGWIISTFFLGWIAGGPLVGRISDNLSKRRPFLMLSSLFAGLFITAFIYLNLPVIALFMIAFVLGLFCSAQLLTYSVAIELNPRSAKGTAAALTNSLVFFFSAGLQPFVGYLLDTTSSYHIALSVFPITLGLAFLTSFLLREKCHPSHKVINGA